MKINKIILAITLMAMAVNVQLNAQTMDNKIPNVSPFPLGKENSGFAQYFSGRSWLAPLSTSKELNVPTFNVTFEPRCRNNWHSHTGGQILIAVGGKGYYQEKGKMARLLLPGDVVEIAQNIVHWHGAAPDSYFSHLAIECNPQNNKNTWLDAVTDKEYTEATADYNKLKLCTLTQTDPEFAALFSNFTNEVVNQNNLEPPTRYMAILATLIGCQGIDEYKIVLASALDGGVTPVEAKEIVYQAVAYCGIGRVLPFISTTNDVLTSRGIKLPLQGQSTTTPNNRLGKGIQSQVDIFGEVMKDFYQSGPDETKHINLWLAQNCFGDYYTRNGLSYQQRELITFCYLAAQGGCEPQLTSHAKANIKVGNSKDFLINVVSQCLPYIGYPRSLNAINCINRAA